MVPALFNVKMIVSDGLLHLNKTVAITAVAENAFDTTETVVPALPVAVAAVDVNVVPNTL